MTVAHLSIDALSFLGATVFYGFRSEIGKWAIRLIMKFIKKFYIDTEHEWRIFMAAYNEAAKTSKR